MNAIIPAKHKGQSTIEYILLVTVVITVAIFFLITPDAPFKNQLCSTYDSAATEAMCSTQRLFDALNNTVP